MKEVVITNPLRTPNGGFGGAFKTVPAYDLAKIVMQRVIADAGIDPGQLDEVILGNSREPVRGAEHRPCRGHLCRHPRTRDGLHGVTQLRLVHPGHHVGLPEHPDRRRRALSSWAAPRT